MYVQGTSNPTGGGGRKCTRMQWLMGSAMEELNGVLGQ